MTDVHGQEHGARRRSVGGTDRTEYGPPRFDHLKIRTFVFTIFASPVLFQNENTSLLVISEVKLDLETPVGVCQTAKVPTAPTYQYSQQPRLLICFHISMNQHSWQCLLQQMLMDGAQRHRCGSSAPAHPRRSLEAESDTLKT